MTIVNLRNAAAVLLAALGLAGCLGGEAGPSSSGSGSGSNLSPSTTSGKPTVTLALATALPASTANTTNTLSFGTPVYAVATVKDGSNLPVANAVVSFASASSMIVFSPVSATALTDASGKASIKLDSASISAAGATSITASTDVSTTSSGTTTTNVTRYAGAFEVFIHGYSGGGADNDFSFVVTKY